MTIDLFLDLLALTLVSLVSGFGIGLVGYLLYAVAHLPLYFRNPNYRKGWPNHR